MNIGSLYRVKKWHWFLFPSKESVSAANMYAARSPLARRPAAAAAYYSTKYNVNVTYFSPDSFIVFLEENRKLKKVLTSDGLIGWTCFVESYNDLFEEVKSE